MSMVIGLGICVPPPPHVTEFVRFFPHVRNCFVQKTLKPWCPGLKEAILHMTKNAGNIILLL
jgi:hypothetical protein